MRPPRKEDGRPWKPTKPKTSPQTTPHPSPLPQGERESRLPQEERKHTKRLGEADDSPFAKGDLNEFRTTESSTSTAVSGTMHLLVIGVDYDDTPATYSASEVQPLIFGSSNSVADYYNDVSYSAVTIEPATESQGTSNDGFIGWLRLSGNHPNPGSNTGNTNAQIAKDAILAADSYIDFASYDTDGDGIVESIELAIVVIVAGYEATDDSSYSPSVWAHYSYNSSGITAVDGKNINQYAQFGEKHSNHLATIGVMCHELGHLIFSLPDLYDTDSAFPIGIGYFDLMGSGCWGAASGEYGGSSPTHLSAWSKEYLGWGTVNTISSSQTISLPKVDSNKASIFRINTLDSNQYFLLENRELSGYDIGFQQLAGTSGHGGLVIYHIDTLKTDVWPSSNTVNADEVDKGVDVEEANEGSLGYSMLDAGEYSFKTNMSFFSGNNTSFADSTTPSSALKDGTPSNISVTDVSTYGDTMTAFVDPNATPVNRSPKAKTGFATNLTSNSATLQGMVNAYSLTTTVWFEYGKTSGSYDSTTSTMTVNGTSDTEVSINISGLSFGTTYYYRLAAQNSMGTVYGSENSFLLTTVTPKIAGGDYHSIALKSDSTVWAWGNNEAGQFGNGSTTSKNIPTQSNISGITAIAAGGGCYDTSFNLALKSDGTVWACGANYFGFLGDGTKGKKYTPVQVKNLNSVVSIACGDYHGLALKSDGTVWTWGFTENNSLNASTIPILISTLNDIVEIEGGSLHSLALKSDGTVWAWGYNREGELGDGTTSAWEKTPVQVSGLTNVVAISGGGSHNLALKSDGTVWAWGANWNGRLGGHGTTTNRNTPVQVSNLSDIIAIAAGRSCSLALKSDGTVWAWGWGGYGELGSGTYADETTPVQITSLSNITTIAAGYWFCLALKSDGTVWAWGSNGYGQLGDGTTTERTSPVQVSNINLGTTSADSIAPTCSISINNGDSYTTSTSVTLNLAATDAFGVTGYYVSTNSTTPSTSDSGWTSVSSTTFYNGSLSYTLNSGEGTKTVYAWYKDATGNISNKASDSIILDTTSPTVTITSPTSDSTYTTSSSMISLSGNASDSGSGISSVTWSNSKGGNGTASGTTSWSISNISLSSGENVITVTATDGVGYTGTDTITVTYTTSTRPTPTATITPKPSISPTPSASPTPSSTPTPTSTCTDDHEPNDSFDTAYGSLVPQSRYQGKICSPFDADYFKINVANPGLISLILNIPPDKDYELFLYDSRQSFVASSTRSMGDPETILYFAGATGTYYVGVIWYSGSFDENQTYTLSWTWRETANPTPTPEPTPPPLPTPSATITPPALCEAESMEISTNSLVLKKGRSGEVAVSVKGAGDCPVEGITVTANVRGSSKRRISVSPAIQTTDEGGDAAFTITAKNRTGAARVTFKAGNLGKTLNAKVRK